MQKVQDLFINGEWVAGAGKELTSVNPATGDVIWRGNSATNAQIEEAINAARNSLASWMNLSINERTVYLEKFSKQLTTNQIELAEALARETGKPLWEAKTEITAMIGKLDISKQAIADRCKDVTKDMQGYTSVTRHKPHGVVVVLGPFNFPGHLPNGHIIPALLAGNTIVFKPSELTSLFAIRTLECWQAAELPAGVINLVLGYGDVGQQLVANKNIDGIFFTGSYATGHHIAAASLEFPKRIVALEMGGNNPLVVKTPRNIDAAVYLTMQSAYTTAGQRCTCARRLIVVRDTQGEQFVESLCEAVTKIKVGSYTEQPEPFMGPLITNAAADKVLAAYERLVESGAEVLVTMRRLKENLAFLTPAILDVTAIKNRADEEIFGPLLQLTWVDDFASAIKEANNTSYGLSAGLICEDENLYKEFIRTINSGVVSWNRPTIGSSSAAPFGGIGKSGNHRPSAYYAADYCSYPVASMETQKLELPATLNPGISI